MLTSSEARTIAETLWGRGGTHARRCNRKGAYYFSCSGHGGFVIDAATLAPAERDALAPYVKPEKYTLYTWGTHRRVMFNGRTRGFRVPHTAARRDGQFYVFEEDCEWSLVYVCTSIRAASHDPIAAEAEAPRVFWRWYDPSNPEVAASIERDRRRAAGDPTLIVSASRISDAVTRVTTASGATHDVVASTYDWRAPELATCTIIASAPE